MKKNFSFQTKITMLIIALILVSIGMTIVFVGKWSLDNMQNKLEENMKNISVILANTPDIQKGLQEKDFTKIQNCMRELLGKLDGVDIITIADMNGIRYAHPNQDKLGKHFVGGDEQKVINEGVGYISQAKGTLGISIRAFEPIFYEQDQIGFVMVGVLYKDIKELRADTLITICGFTLFGIILGIIGALIIAKRTKDSLLGLEPYEIVYMYKENRAMLESIMEGIIAIDSKGRITLVNDYAINILNIKKPNVVGEYVLDVFPTSRLLEVLKSGECEYNEEQIINDTVILTNRVPMKDGDETIGAMASFNDRTKVKRLAEEITGVRQIIQALRTNTHEFMNKLHVILGLVKLNEIEELRMYIKDIVKEQEQIRFFLTKNIKNPTISAIILGKLNRAKELNVDMELCENCYLEKHYKNIQNENLLTIIGNLLDNAMEATIRKGEDGEVYFRIEDIDDFIEIEVNDNGIGIEDKNVENILKRGFTTKNDEGGIGLFLVQKSINQLKAKLLIDSEYKEGTSILVRIPKEEKV